MDRREILYLFQRPTEPITIPKGDEKVGFNIPPNYLSEKYQPVAASIFDRVAGDTEKKYNVKPINIPNLQPALALSRREPFSIFVPKHKNAADHLISLFLGMRIYDDLLSLAIYVRDRVNPELFVYALSVAILHRSDTKDLPVPHLMDSFPAKFIDGGVFARVVEEANVVPAGSRRPIVIPLDFTATDHDPEHRVAYWREDIGVNLHHYHWHLVYPFAGPESVVRKDRRGELFYYMHHQMIARFNTERLCNKLARVRRLNEFRDPINEAYFPKLDSTVASRTLPGRPAMSFLQDVDRPSDNLKAEINAMVRSRDRIIEAINLKSVKLPNGNVSPLTDENGIDILGNLIEASSISLNPAFYGSLHNNGHVLTAYCHDPDNRYLESFAAMGDVATALRDPVFYRWHSHINEIFISYKHSLEPYTVNQLTFPGISVTDCRINTPGVEANTLMTHWTQDDFELGHGLDFAPRGSITVTVTHIDHKAFSYTIQVNNSNPQPKQGTVRIFMAPSLDEAGLPLNFAEQKILMIEMDRFSATLIPGMTIIQRNSVDSAVTIPFESTFRSANSTKPSASDASATSDFNYCGCGWPQHMLIPRGTKDGYDMDLFVMISDYDIDRVVQPGSDGCRGSTVYCGLRDRKYPDSRAMGYPFDRIARPRVATLAQFLTPNMNTTKITVKFTDTILPNPRKSNINDNDNNNNNDFIPTVQAVG